MAYTVRGLEWCEETNFGEKVEATIAINYLIDWDITTTPEIDEQEVAGGDRDALAKAKLGKGCAGRFTAKFLSPKFFKYALGSVSASTIDPYTVTPAAVLPSLSFMRGAKTPVNVGMYWGAKVDSAVLNLAVGEAVTYEINFVAAQSSLYTGGYTVPTADFTLEPFSFIHGKVEQAGTLIPDLQACVIEIANNLEARFAANVDAADPRAAVSIREGRLGVTGRITFGDTLEPMVQKALASTPFTLELTLIKGAETITLNLPNVTLTEWADTGAGREPYEIEFPFLAAPVTGLDIMTVVHEGSDWDSAVS